MAIEVKVNQYGNFMEVIVTGTYDMQDAINRFPEVLSACRLSGISKVIIDFRRMEGVPAATEKALYGFGVQDHYRKHLLIGGQKVRVAYLGKSPFVSTYDPGLQIVRDSNMPFELFTNIEEAREWLGVKSG